MYTLKFLILLLLLSRCLDYKHVLPCLVLILVFMQKYNRLLSTGPICLASLCTAHS